MSLFVIILLILCSTILLILELLIIPGGIVGITAFILMVFCVFRAYYDLGNEAGTYVLIGTILLNIIVIKIAFSSNAWKRIAHKGTINSKASDTNSTHIQIGNTGKTLSELRPMGNALIDNNIIEVTTTGFIIKANEKIIVSDIKDHKIYVEKISIV